MRERERDTIVCIPQQRLHQKKMQETIPKTAKTIHNSTHPFVVNKNIRQLQVCYSKNYTTQHSQTFRGGK